MLALIINGFRTFAASVTELWKFVDAVVQDMRQTREELENRYGPLGF